MKPQEVQRIFEKAQALLEGHFVLSSGNHSNRYLQCALVTQFPAFAAQLAEALAQPFVGQNVDVVLGPAVGGIVIAQEVAQALYRAGNQKVRAVFCERVEGKMALRRGFTLNTGERMLAVEDVVTTGGSVREAVELAKQHGVEVLAVGCFVDRSQGKAAVGAPLHGLLQMEAAIYAPGECPLCQQNLPAVKPGSRGLRS